MTTWQNCYLPDPRCSQRRCCKYDCLESQPQCISLLCQIQAVVKFCQDYHECLDCKNLTPTELAPSTRSICIPTECGTSSYLHRGGAKGPLREWWTGKTSYLSQVCVIRRRQSTFHNHRGVSSVSLKITRKTRVWGLVLLIDYLPVRETLVRLVEGCSY